jgi:RND family efflux transporter MFP subunit
MRGGGNIATYLGAVVAILLIPGFAAAQGGPPPALVVTAEVTSGPVTEEVTLAGTVRPIRDSLIASEVSGRVLERTVENGDEVREGASLIVLDRKRLERDLAEAEAELDEVEARVAQAHRREKRARELLTSEVVPQSLLDDAVAERAAQEGRKAQVEARIASIQDDLERSVIRAPFGGVVTEIHTEVGQWLQMSEPVVRLADFHTIEVTLDAPERYYPHIARGDAAPATLDALPSVTLDGKVFAVVPRAGSAARTFPVLVRAPNPGHQVGAGMLARVHLVLSSSEAVLRVPKDAIVRQQQGQVVYRVNGDTVEVITVETGRSDGALIEVGGELQSGDRVVIRGNERLMPGQRVIEGDAGASSAGSL